MSSKIKKYQPDRKDLLINTDWGIEETELSQQEATERCMILWEGRWITDTQRRTLEEQRLTYCLIRSASIVLAVLGVVTGFLIHQAGYSVPVAVALALSGTLAGFFLWRFHLIGWGLGTITFAFLGIACFFTATFFQCEDDTFFNRVYVVVGFTLAAAATCCLVFLFTKKARAIWRKGAIKSASGDGPVWADEKKRASPEAVAAAMDERTKDFKRRFLPSEIRSTKKKRNILLGWVVAAILVISIPEWYRLMASQPTADLYQVLSIFRYVGLALWAIAIFNTCSYLDQPAFRSLVISFIGLWPLFNVIVLVSLVLQLRKRRISLQEELAALGAQRGAGVGRL